MFVCERERLRDRERENCSNEDLETMEKLDSRDKAKILERGNVVTS